MTTWADVVALFSGVTHATHMVYTVAGTYATWDVGYPADLGRALEATGLFEWQGIDYPAVAFPMNPSVLAGVAELKRQIRLRPPWRKWTMIGYSQGAIVTSLVYDAVRFGDMQEYRASFIGAVTFGNPRRQEGHTIPGGIDPGGHGIVTPNMVDTEDLWWDFAAGKTMVGSPGQDLYCTCGYGETAEAVADQEAVWQIVDLGTIASIGDLATEVVKILPHPLKGGIGAAEAALGALGFFASGTAPHVNYQFIQPIAGDPRDCWALALDYLTQVGAKHPAYAAA